ncbi:MAG: hypothetical protein ACK44D_01455 [Bacteroidia bacterium]|jgi:hypothetical protein
MTLINDIHETGKIILIMPELISHNNISNKQISELAYVLIDVSNELRYIYRSSLRHELPLEHCIKLEQHANQLELLLQGITNLRLVEEISNKLKQSNAVPLFFEQIKNGTIDLVELNKLDEAADYYLSIAKKLQNSLVN